MRNVKAAILLGIGVMFIALAPLLRFYALPHLEKQQLDFYYTDVAQGQGTYFDTGTLKMAGPVLLTASRTERGDVNAGTDSVAVWNIFTKVQIPSGTAIQAVQDRWAFNRKSGVSVSGYGSLPHAGQYLVWPFNAEKKTYSYWDPTAKRAFPARYVDTEKIQGHTVYRYTSVIPPVKIGSTQFPGSLIGQPNAALVTLDEYYANPESSVLIVPRTGAAVGGSSHEKVTLRVPGTSADLLSVLDVNLTATPQSVKGLLKKSDDGAKQLNLIGIWAPIVGLVLGLVLVGVAFWWDRRRRVVALPGAGVRSPRPTVPGQTTTGPSMPVSPATRRH